MITKIRDFFWPVLERQTTCEVMESRRSESDDINSIQNTGWAAASKLALEEARRLASEEDERRKTAESKASNLLVVAAALIPLLTYLETAILDGKLTAPTWMTLPLLAFAIACLCNACWWAFKTVGVGTYHRVYPIDLVKIWRAGKPIEKKLVVETFVAIRRNQETVNLKVSASEMTHKFLLRAVMAFSSLLLVRISFGLLGILK